MIPFFRKIRKKLADDNRPIQYIRYAIGEIVLVVIGILIALQINNWNEDNKSRKIEHKLLRELRDDLEETKADLLTDIVKAQFWLRVTDSLYQQILHDRAENNPRPIRITTQFIYNRSDLFPKKSAYQSLQAFGINLVSNDSLRKGITDFYELQLIRVESLEQYIKETHEKELAPYLMQVSKPTDDCKGCNSLEELFSNDSLNTNNFYEVDAPSDRLLHFFKTKYMAYSALTRLYTATQRGIDYLIETIDLETGP